jgi:ribosomal-protein-alanine N-acetyltransferase
VSTIRTATPADAQAILELRRANRGHLEPFEPDVDDPESRYQLEGVRRWIGNGLGRFLITDEDAIAGTIGLFDLRGKPFESAILGYWVDSGRNGRGLATHGVGEAIEVAFGVLGLHRVEAGTRLDNLASQRVLEKNGFTQVGVLRRNLLIGGEWHDHLLWEKLADD